MVKLPIDFEKIRREKPHGRARFGTQRVFSKVGYRIEAGGLRLIYRTRPRGGEWRDVDELIPFTSTATQFGGKRVWFACPSCQKRCRIIYGGCYFRCRRCHGLRYESQYEDAISRAASQRHKLRKRLGYVGSLEDPFPLKPKGMHWTTYEQLQARDEECEQRWVVDGHASRVDAGRGYLRPLLCRGLNIHALHATWRVSRAGR